jgi:prepilin-type N-terminal cleavage/methylation domain-containing protein
MNIPSRDGFTLIEAVVSIAIVSIGFVGIYSVFVVAEKSFAKTFEKNRLILTASSMIEDIGSDQININDFRDMNLDRTDDLYDDLEKERRLNKIREKWKKRLGRAKHKNTDKAPVKLKDFRVEEGEGDQNLLTVEMEGKQDVEVTFHRLFRKKEE